MNNQYTEEEEKFLSWFRDNLKSMLVGLFVGIIDQVITEIQRIFIAAVILQMKVFIRLPPSVVISQYT